MEAIGARVDRTCTTWKGSTTYRNVLRQDLGDCLKSSEA